MYKIILVMLFMGNIFCDVFLVNDLNLWQSQFQNVVVFETNSNNIGLANEVGGNPNSGDLLPGILTFINPHTGLGLDFSIAGTQDGTSQESLTFVNNQISPGATGADENDDINLNFSNFDNNLNFDGVGFIIDNNDFTQGEEIRIFGENGLIETFTNIPASGGEIFFGFISDETITRIEFDEDLGQADNVGFKDVHFAFNAIPAVPEPSTYIALVIGLSVLVFGIKRR